MRQLKMIFDGNKSHVQFQDGVDGLVILTVGYPDIGSCCWAAMNRSRVERLRDWLTAWLEANPAKE
jgi:hypothetical protein